MAGRRSICRCRRLSCTAPRKREGPGRGTHFERRDSRRTTLLRINERKLWLQEDGYSRSSRRCASSRSSADLQNPCGKLQKKPQISPLRCAPVEMTNLLHGNCQLSSGCTPVHGSTNLSSRPERTCHVSLDVATCAAFANESRMKFANATKLNRKFGAA